MVQDTIKILYLIYIWGHLTVNDFVYIVNVYICTQIGEYSDKHCGMSSMADNISCSDKYVSNFFKLVTGVSGVSCIILSQSTISSEVFSIIAMHL